MPVRKPRFHGFSPGSGESVACEAMATSAAVSRLRESPLCTTMSTPPWLAISAPSAVTLSPLPGLKPWNLGFLTGMPVKEAVPYIVQHVKEMPDTAVMGGESFNEFKRRAFTGLQEALDLSTGQRLAIVSHHWIERLVKAWQAAGAPADLTTDPDVVLDEGNGTGTAELLTVDANAIRQAVRADPAVKRRKLNGSSKVFLEARA